MVVYTVNSNIYSNKTIIYISLNIKQTTARTNNTLKYNLHLFLFVISYSWASFYF